MQHSNHWSCDIIGAIQPKLNGALSTPNCTVQPLCMLSPKKHFEYQLDSALLSHAGQTVHHAWLNDLEESFNRSMKLDEEGAAQEPGGREGLTVPLDVSMNSVLSQPLTWSFTSLELPEGVSNPLGPSQHANHWSQGPDIPVSGNFIFCFIDSFVCSPVGSLRI